MTSRLFATLLTVAFAMLTVRAAEKPAADENPYKNTKVGDYVTYKMSTKIAGLNLDGTVTQTVTAKTAKEATVKVVAKVAGMEAPAQEQKIDLTLPYDPTKTTNLPAGADAKVEKLKTGKESIKVAGKEYECDWATYKIKGKAGGIEIDADIKVWTAKNIPMGMAKMTMSAKIMDMNMEMTMEMTETGNTNKN
jgi:hypothetical protein